MLGCAPYKANYKNAFGKLILASYNKKSTCSKKKVKADQKYYEVLIPSSWVERHGATFLSEESIKDFIEHIDHRFKRELYCYIDGVIDFKNNYNATNKEKIVAKMKDASLLFLQKNGFNEDTLKFETIKKGYQRHTGHNKTFARVG